MIGRKSFKDEDKFMKWSLLEDLIDGEKDMSL